MAGSAAEAWRVLERVVPDVIVFEFVLPDSDGLSLCSALRAQYTTTMVNLRVLAKPTRN
jgi:DNA-binding response OmpR family regulator